MSDITDFLKQSFGAQYLNQSPEGQMMTNRSREAYLKQLQYQQQANPGYVPGSEYNVNFGLAKRDMGGPGMQAYGEQMGGFNQALGDVNQTLGGGGLGGILGQQQDLARMLSQRAAGTGGPTAAQSLFQSNLDAANRNAMSLGQSQAGVSPGAALRSILEAQGQNVGQASAQAAALRAQEQQAATGQLGGVLGGMGGETLGAAQARLGAAQARMGAAGLGAQMSEQDRQALLDLERQRLGAWGTQVGSDTAIKAGENKMYGDIAGGVLGGAGSVGAAFAGKGGARGGMVRGKDSSKYDTVPAMLSPGEIVLPRSVAQDDDAPERARDFVAAIRKAHGGAVHYGGTLAKLRDIQAKLAELEKELA